MADLYEPDVGTAYYRSTDPVKNLQISIKLDRITSSSIVPQTGQQQGVELQQQEAAPSGQDGMELKDLTKQGIKDTDEMVIKWQQKVFSQYELDFYSVEENCDNVVAKKYHNEVMALLAGERPKNRIFTYVDHDTFSQQDELTQFLTTSPDEHPSYLAEKMAHLRRRKIGGVKRRKDGDGVKAYRDVGFVPKVNVVETSPSEDLVLKNHIMAAPVQVMHIMGDLSPRERIGTAEDHEVLCTIYVDANGVLCMRPDFNRGRKPYIVETQSLSREVFEYTLEHASKQMNRQEQDRELKMYREVYTRHKDFLSAAVGLEFEIPPSDVLRLAVFGELNSVKDFEFDDLYIHFFVDLPRHWSAEHHQQLSWVTQTCASKVEGRDNVAYFSFPFNFELFYRNDSIKEEEQDLLPHFPTLLIEVLSLDSMNRFRTEGYAYLTIPSSPGTSKHTLHCWRPVGESLGAQLRRFFIGGSPELEDPTYSSVPSTFEGSHLSKFGFRTETTGQVNLNLNVIMQSRAFMEKKASKKSLGSLLDNLGIGVQAKNISHVLDAFKKARLRMLNARENAQKELMKETIKKEVAT